MDTTLAQPPTKAPLHEAATGPRIYFLHPLLAGPLEAWGPHLERIVRLGFSHVLIAPPFAAAEDGNLYVTADPDMLDPRIAPATQAHDGIARIAEACRSHGLSLLVDVVLDRIAADSAPARTRPDLFCASVPRDTLDPRRITEAGIASACAASPDFSVWWAARLTSLAPRGRKPGTSRPLPKLSAASAKVRIGRIWLRRNSTDTPSNTSDVPTIQNRKISEFEA